MSHIIWLLVPLGNPCSLPAITCLNRSHKIRKGNTQQIMFHSLITRMLYIYFSTIHNIIQYFPPKWENSSKTYNVGLILGDTFQIINRGNNSYVIHFTIQTLVYTIDPKDLCLHQGFCQLFDISFK